MKKIKLLFLASIVVFCLVGCIKVEKKDFITEGYKPVYISYQNAYNIYSSAPRVISNPGKIYIYDSLIFVVERNSGIHIINNVNPSNPKLISFINVYGNVDLAIRNNYMYIDNFRDIVTLDISNITKVQPVSRIKNVYPAHYKNYPDEKGWFECVDTTKGIVSGWVKVKLINPKCKRNDYFE